jgi:rubrerythrin
MVHQEPDRDDPHAPEDRPVLEESCPHCGFRFMTADQPPPDRCPLCGRDTRLVSDPALG